MKKKTLHGLWLLLFLSACVTINIYFPAAQAEKAAERIVDDILGTQKDKQKAPPAKDDKGALRYQIDPLRAFAAIGDLLIPSAQAAQPNFSVDSPRIRQLQASMKRRHGQLTPYYNKGAVGFARDGLIALRDANAVSLRERGKLRQLVNAENADRNALYRAIAEANGHPEWESDVRAVFAQKWVQRARDGWWYQAGNGSWRQK